MTCQQSTAWPRSRRAWRRPEFARWRRRALAVAIAAPIVLVAAQAASAATWNFQGTAFPSGASTWGLNGVACQASGECVAVGSYTDSGGASHVLAEERQGATWSQLSAAELEGTTNSEFNAVACPSATDCTAVGDYDNGTGQLPLVENFDGTPYWSIAVFPTPPGAVTSELLGISCPTTSLCVAVGDYSDSPDGSGETLFAAVLHGSTWSLSTPSIPSGSVSSDLAGVSCKTATACTAVGSYSDGNGGLSLAEGWNGSAWTVQPTPATASSGLSGVSCTWATTCTAVGLAGQALRWNGTTWSVQALAKPHRGTVPDLASVVCTAADACTAVGDYYVEGVANPAAEFWNGTTWAFQTISIGTSFDTAFLNGLACQPLVSCTAVGTYQDPVDGYHSFAETISVQWHVQTTPLPSGAVASNITDVSCPSTTMCMAPAYWIGNDPGLNEFTEMWNGTSWTDGTVPNPATTELRSVSCPSAKACTAVGDDTADNGVLPLAAQWNGTSWTENDLPLPAGKTDALLSDVSCASATRCLAVGTASNAANQAEPISESLSGSTWTVTAIPAPAGSVVGGVSCATATDCVAVGQGPSASLAAGWNGTGWTIQATADPSGSTQAVLNGVSCTAASFCLAVGSDNNGSRQVTLSEFWNGTRWTGRATPPLTSDQADELLRVSCATPDACTAVGDVTAPGHSVPSPLAEHWTGSTWGVQVTAAPAGSHGGELTGVSCRSDVYCTAVGYDNGSYLTALAEQFS